MVLGYSNGVEGYIGLEKDYRLAAQGGYETSPLGAALGYGNRLPLAPDAERPIKAGIAQVLRAVKSA